MKNIFALLGFCVSLTVPAMQPQVWHSGEITLNSAQVLNGEIRYDALTDLLQVKDNATLKVYSARQLSSFIYFDVAANTVRRFLSLPDPVRRRSRAKVFLEVVLAGEMYLLRRPHSPRNARMLGGPVIEMESPWYDSKNVFEYFIYANGGFTPLERFQKAVLPRLMREFATPLQAFIQKRNLNLFTQRGRFLLINQYNVLKAPAKIALM